MTRYETYEEMSVFLPWITVGISRCGMLAMTAHTIMQRSQIVIPA
jgi:heme exporter protein D